MLTKEQKETVQRVQETHAYWNSHVASSTDKFSKAIFNDINSLIKIISELSAKLDEMPLSFTGGSYERVSKE